MPTDPATIRAYLQAKGALIRYFRGPGKSLTDIYEHEIQKPTIAGAILPDWVLALGIIVGLVSGGFTIADVLSRMLKGKANKQDVKVQSGAILSINEVQNLNIILNQARKPTRQRPSRKRVGKRTRRAKPE
jgi:hypothetical protein